MPGSSSKRPTARFSREIRSPSWARCWRICPPSDTPRQPTKLRRLAPPAFARRRQTFFFRFHFLAQAEVALVAVARHRTGFDGGAQRATGLLTVTAIGEFALGRIFPELAKAEREISR